MSFRAYLSPVLSLAWVWPRVEHVCLLVSILIGIPNSLGFASSYEYAHEYAHKYEEALSFLSKNKWVEASVLLKEIIKSMPNDLPAHLNLAKALTLMGRREEALSSLWRWVSQIHGPEREIAQRRAKVLARIFLTKSGAQIYQEGLQLFRDKKYNPAIEKFQKTLTLEPNHFEALLRLGQCLSLKGDSDSAAEILRLAKKLDPTDPDLHLGLGKSLFQRGELKEALSELKLVPSETPSLFLEAKGFIKKIEENPTVR